MALTSDWKNNPYLESTSEQTSNAAQQVGNGAKPGIIEEVSEPSSPHSSRSSQHSPCRSALTDLIKNSPPTEESLDSDVVEGGATAGIHPVTVREAIISQPGERTPLLSHRTAYGSIKDLESQKTVQGTKISKRTLIIQQLKDRCSAIVRVTTNPKAWNRQDIWEYGVRGPASLIPPVILGLLLNVLDALSYGQIQPRELIQRHN